MASGDGGSPPTGRRQNKVKVGFFSFTEITDESEHLAYNEWHQFDHIPENIALAGIAHGQRWARSPRCAELHLPGGSPELALCHYVTLYLMTEPVETTLREFKTLGAELSAVEGRFHRHRFSHLNGPFDVTGSEASPHALVAPEAVPYRPNTGIYVSALESAGQDELGLGLSAELLDLDGVAGVWRFEDRTQDQRHRTITVYYLDGDVLSTSAQLRAGLATADRIGSASKLLVEGPYDTITPGEWDWFDQ